MKGSELASAVPRSARSTARSRPGLPWYRGILGYAASIAPRIEAIPVHWSPRETLGCREAA